MATDEINRDVAVRYTRAAEQKRLAGAIARTETGMITAAERCARKAVKNGEVKRVYRVIESRVSVVLTEAGREAIATKGEQK